MLRAHAPDIEWKSPQVCEDTSESRVTSSYVTASPFSSRQKISGESNFCFTGVAPHREWAEARE